MESRQSYSNQGNDNVRVIVRVRPPLSRQLDGEVFMSTVQVSKDRRIIQLFEYYNMETLNEDQLESYIENPRNYVKHQYTFDYVYDDDASQQEIYENTAKLSVVSALQGYNSTIFAYGQTGTGKTYTMQGFRYNMFDEQRGIIPRAVEDIFRYIQSVQDEETTFMVRASYIQIYNEVISDLLRKQKNNLQIREDARKGVYIQGISEWAIVRPQEIIELMKMGAKNRATARTNMNQSSSRSHAVFIIIIEQMRQTQRQMEQGKQLKVAKLNLVDLAGSERVRVTGASGKRLDECKNINKSLSCLGMVIAALTQSRSQSHIPYRNSSLTRLLSDSLGGNCKTTMFTMISPAPEAFHQSLSSLKFAHRAKSIKNRPEINEDLDQKALIRKYETELKKLRTELDQKNKVLIDKTKLMQLQEEKRKIQQDKNNVMRAFEQRSREFFKEREQKKRLQQKIKAFNSQLIHTGHTENAMIEHQKLIKQYQKKIKNLQMKNENQSIDTETFMKQNVILMSLASKLNERDEAIAHLNQELLAYQRITKESIDNADIKSKRIQQLQMVLKKNKIPLPPTDQIYMQRNSNGMVGQKGGFQGQKMDGVLFEGQMTYNVTQKNLKHVQNQIMNLKEENTQIRQQRDRLRQQLKQKQRSSINAYKSGSGKFDSKDDSNHKSSSTTIYQNSNGFSQNKENYAMIEGYKSIKNSIQLITRGLQKKQNTDMKLIIGEIFKIRKVVNQVVQQ